jgi:hypothetical protein
MRFAGVVRETAALFDAVDAPATSRGRVAAADGR